MADAFKSAKHRIAKSAVSSAEHMDPLLFSFVDKPSEIPYTPRKRKNKKRRTKERENNTPDSVNNGHEKEAKVEKKISQPPKPGAHSNCHKSAESVTCAEDNNNNNNVKAITPSADERKESSKAYTPANVEGKKDSHKTKSLKDLTSGATSKPAEQSLASNGVLLTKPETTQVSEQETRNNFAPEQDEEKASLEEVHSIPSYRPKLSVFIKGKKQPKASWKETSELFPKEDGSSGCGGNVDKPHGSGTSGQLTAPKTDMSGEKKENTSADSHDDNEMMSSFFKKLLENGPKKGTKTKQGQFEIFAVIEKSIFLVRS